MGPTPTPQTSPWGYTATDYQGKILSISVTFNETTRAPIQATISRDVGCRYSKILIGVGADGKPDSTPRTFNVPQGVSTYTAAQLHSGGIDTIEDITSRQITAGT